MPVFESLTIGKKIICFKVILDPGTDVKLWLSTTKQLKDKGWKKLQIYKQGMGSYYRGVGKTETGIY